MSVKKFFFRSSAVRVVLVLAVGLFAVLILAKAIPGAILNKNSFEEIDAYIEKKMKSLNIPGAALAIVEGDKIVHFRGFGLARPDGETPAPQTPFILGSITKSFTALAVMQLVEAGKIEHWRPYFQGYEVDTACVHTGRHAARCV